MKEKSPLGIIPKYLWDEKRCQELERTIVRYVSSEKLIPVEWIEELNELRGSKNRETEPLFKKPRREDCNPPKTK